MRDCERSGKRLRIHTGFLRFVLQKFSDFDKFFEVQAFYDVFMRMNAVGL